MECSTACVPKNIDVHFIPINKISNLCNCSYKYVATCNVIYYIYVCCCISNNSEKSHCEYHLRHLSLILPC